MMRARTRKLIGTIVLLLFLAVYATLAAMIASSRIALAPLWSLQNYRGGQRRS